MALDGHSSADARCHGRGVCAHRRRLGLWRSEPAQRLQHDLQHHPGGRLRSLWTGAELQRTATPDGGRGADLRPGHDAELPPELEACAVHVSAGGHSSLDVGSRRMERWPPGSLLPHVRRGHHSLYICPDCQQQSNLARVSQHIQLGLLGCPNESPARIA